MNNIVMRTDGFKHKVILLLLSVCFHGSENQESSSCVYTESVRCCLGQWFSAHLGVQGSLHHPSMTSCDPKMSNLSNALDEKVVQFEDEIRISQYAQKNSNKPKRPAGVTARQENIPFYNQLDAIY